MGSAQKTETIRVTARFEVTFLHKVTKEQFEELDADSIKVDEVVDESVAYNALSSDGDCEMEWDYGPPPPRKLKPPKARRVRKK